MKSFVLFSAILSLCLSSSSGEERVKTETGTDTITNVTNPGVGSVADDTSTQTEKN